jgi:DNA (cytosine-5)-methyltransferase 1
MPKKRARPLRAIDLYSGVGGWALGLRMAGIEVIASYEKWGPANETNFKNNHHQAQTVDIRGLALADLPQDIDIIVGSPPCTQFSYSNRGGGGNINDGLQDIIKFLSVVAHLKPKAWAMENVPRVAAILERELRPKGRLSKFIGLGMSHCVVNMQDYGLPQRRRRCIAGKFDLELLQSYAGRYAPPTLGDVVKALSARKVKDPVYGIEIETTALLDHVTEDHLNTEEERVNRAGKVTHPVYNAMPFPDPLNRSVRTITATCTRVSRESIVIEDPKAPGRLRRLTIRERASLQGFPVTFQFYGASYGAKLRMVGNAVPPLVSFFLGQALRGVQPGALIPPSEGVKAFLPPTPVPKTTPPDTAGANYPWERTFRFAIPSLRLKSGVRFELRNVRDNDNMNWEVAFVFGSSKSIQTLSLSTHQCSQILSCLPPETRSFVKGEMMKFGQYVRLADIPHMQDVWSHRGPGGIRPFMFLDQMDQLGRALIPIIAEHDGIAQLAVMQVVKSEYKRGIAELVGLEKLKRNAPLILAGIVIGAYANAGLGSHGSQVHIDARRKKRPKRA